MAQILITFLVLVVASVATGSPLFKPSSSKPKPSQVGTAEPTILIEGTITATQPASRFPRRALAESRQPSRQEFSRNPPNLSSQNSMKLFNPKPVTLLLPPNKRSLPKKKRKIPGKV
ncbi:U4 [Hyposoter didymator ichnovirus]|nr:U4 [Hyposoter didymator ichnovirus]